LWGFVQVPPEKLASKLGFEDVHRVKSGERRFAAMKKFLVFVLVLAVAVGALGYWRGWFSMSKEGVQVNAEKFKEDKAAFSKTVGEKTTALKDKVAGLRKTSEGLTGDEKAKAEKELVELEKKHDRLEKQLQELEQAGPDKFADIKQDLSKRLEEVEKKSEELTKKLEKKDK